MSVLSLALALDIYPLIISSGVREQINQVTSFLDASTIYGSSKEESDELRAFQKGLIKVQRGPGGTQVLQDDDNQIDCQSQKGRNK